MTKAWPFGSTNLSDVVASSPTAMDYALQCERNAAISSRLGLAAGLLLVGARIAAENGASDGLTLGVALGGVGVYTAAIPFSRRAQRSFSRAIWEYNGSLPRQ